MPQPGSVSSSEQRPSAVRAASSLPSAATAFTLLDDERQDGYHRQPVKTFAPHTTETDEQPGLPGLVSAVCEQDASGLTFSAFMTALMTPTWRHPADAALVFPIYAADAVSTGQPLADADVKRASTEGVATRSALDPATPAYQPAHFTHRRPRDKDGASVPSLPLLPVDPNVTHSARQRHSVSPSASTAAVKRQKVTHNGFHPTQQPAASIGRKRPRSSAVSAQSASRSAEATRRSRERSASRSRAFTAAHSQLQWQRLPLSDDKDGGSARRRRALQYKSEDAASEPAGYQSSDEEEAGMDDLSRCLRHRKDFSRRMGREKLRVQELLSAFGYAVRLEEEQDEAERIAFELQAELHPDATAPASSDKDSKRRSRRRNKEEEQHWMRQDNAFVKADIDRVRKAMMQQQAVLQPTASHGSAGAQTSSAPSSPASLVSLSPPSSRSVSPLPNRSRSRSRSHSRSRSPSVAADFESAIQSVSKQPRKPSSHAQSQPASAHPLYHTPPALAGLRHSKQLVRLLCNDAAVVEQPSTYVVEAIIAHRPAAHQQRSSAASAADAIHPSSFTPPKELTAWEADWRDWRSGVQYEYEVKWLGFRQTTWEPQRGLGPFLVNEYWHGRGCTLWTDEEVHELRKKMGEANGDRQQTQQQQQQQQTIAVR